MSKSDALQRRNEGYAIHFALDWNMDRNGGCGPEPTDENLATVLRDCARAPRPEEYPAIRAEVERYRRGEVPTVTVTFARKRYRLEFSKLPGRPFGPYEFAEAITQLYVAALLSRLEARNLVMDAATSADRTATAPMG